MSDRKRINISVTPIMYDKLVEMQHSHGFNNLCEMIVSMVNVMVDRVATADQRVLDMPDDDSTYIDQMFDEFTHTHSTPCGIVPKQHRTKRIDK